MPKKKRRNGLDKLLLGAVVGAAVGSVIGVTIAPKSGKETRDEIRDKARAVLHDKKGFDKIHKMPKYIMVTFLQKLRTYLKAKNESKTKK